MLKRAKPTARGGRCWLSLPCVAALVLTTFGLCRRPAAAPALAPPPPSLGGRASGTRARVHVQSGATTSADVGGVLLLDAEGAKGGLPNTPIPAAADPDLPFFPDGAPSTACVAWRASASCDPDGPRAPENDTTCATPARGPGYCELLNVEPALPGGEDGAVAITKRRALRRGCEAFPVEVSCGDAPEFLDFAAAADNHLEPGWEPPEPGSRGIVIAVSDGLLISAYAVVRLLRAHGCKLPIDLWAFPDELTEASREALKELTLVYGAKLHKIMASKDALCSDANRCFGIKPYALFHARFESVLLLDSDNFPVRDPTYLFDSHEFLEAGAIFWPDFWNPGNSIFGVTRHSHVWDLLGVPFVDMFEQESGQLLVNRARHVAPLHLMMYYAKPDKLLWRWKLVWGDKDLFRLAWMRAGAAFHMVQTPPGAAGTLIAGRFCGLTMVQHDPAGNRIFMHRNSYKLAPDKLRQAWDMVISFTGSNPLADYRAEAWAIRWRNPLVDTCFGIRQPQFKTNWKAELVPGVPELARLEATIIKYAKELLNEDD
eukprot:jgi/Tetstr1/446455/TSEL_033996.t1